MTNYNEKFVKIKLGRSIRFQWKLGSMSAVIILYLLPNHRLGAVEDLLNGLIVEVERSCVKACLVETINQRSPRALNVSAVNVI